MLIGLIADIHARPDALEDALRQLQQRGAQRILCADDIAGYHDDLLPCIELLERHGVTCVQGNHDRAYCRDHPDTPAAQWLASLPLRHQECPEGQRLLLVHDAPVDAPGAGIRLLDRRGREKADALREWRQRLAGIEADILVVGHSHQVYAVRLGPVLLINPGSCPFNHSAALLELPPGRVEFLPLEGRPLRRSWNFSDSLRRRASPGDS